MIKIRYCRFCGNQYKYSNKYPYSEGYCSEKCFNTDNTNYGRINYNINNMDDVINYKTDLEKIIAKCLQEFNEQIKDNHVIATGIDIDIFYHKDFHINKIDKTIINNVSIILEII